VTGVNGQAVTSAKIRLYNVNGSVKGGDFYRVSDNTWQEGTVTWNNAPAADATPLATLGSVSANTWVEVDVTSLITGDGTYSLRAQSGPPALCTCFTHVCPRLSKILLPRPQSTEPFYNFSHSSREMPACLRILASKSFPISPT
jgi:hypothetical protein